MERRRDIPPSSVQGSSRSAIGLEWFARIAAVAAVVLLVLVLGALERGRIVQASAKGIVDDFHTANDFFAERADFGSPATARKQLQELRSVLVKLQNQTEKDVSALSATVPDVQRLLEAGQGDVRIAHRLDSTATVLRGYAADLRQVAVNADDTVSAVNGEVERSIALVVALNNELAEIERKLAAVPARPESGGDG
ncbi:hypothetical protein [Haloechinothrix salitolerans]|uniref:DUF5667 domain-containing protein n=1 Tax=Haloechinothrix salitolerans TaxID=926830 RepID=A0ABW2C6C3_9PSEU